MRRLIQAIGGLATGFSFTLPPYFLNNARAIGAPVPPLLGGPACRVHDEWTLPPTAVPTRVPNVYSLPRSLPPEVFLIAPLCVSGHVSG